MDTIGKCRTSQPYKNVDAVVAVSRIVNSTYTFPQPKEGLDPSSYSKEMGDRLNNINYYLGTPKS